LIYKDTSFLTSIGYAHTIFHKINNLASFLILKMESLRNTNYNLSERLYTLLKFRDLTLSSAESCTGGMFAKYITDVPGSSEVFLGSIVSYSNSAKENLLRVSAETLQTHGAVSSECAREMALGCKNAFNSQIAISITGIAGPGGATPKKPVGLVYGHIIYEEKHIPLRFQFQGNRDEIRELTCNRMLEEILDCIL